MTQLASIFWLSLTTFLPIFNGITIRAVAKASAAMQDGAITETLRILEFKAKPFLGLIEWTYFFPVKLSIENLL